MAMISPARPGTSRTIPGSAVRCARDCYDYDAAVLFNACAGDLWRRFSTYLPRQLARLAGVSLKALGAALRIRYVKVAEYQARGVVHFHAVIRARRQQRRLSAAPGSYSAGLLCDAIVQAADAVSLVTGPDSSPVRLGFGAQTDARPIRQASDLPGTGQALSGQAVANYIAKYATKSLIVPGLPDRRIRTTFDMQALHCSAHFKRMIATAWQLGAKQATSDPRLRQWAHMLGYGGHFLTKSRRYSVTFGELRAARTEHRRTQRHPDGERDPWGRPSRRARSWSWPPGPTPEPATPPPPQTPSSPRPRPPEPANTTTRPTMPPDPMTTDGRRPHD